MYSIQSIVYIHFLFGQQLVTNSYRLVNPVELNCDI